jgi:hypothetical protein
MALRLPATLLSCLLLCSACGGQKESSPDSGQPQPIGGAPYVLYTDILSGPTSGGENDKGVYLSIFGKNFGSAGLGSTVRVYINDAEVDNYRRLAVSRGRPDVQQITVQVGAIGHPAPGTALPIKVVVGGVASNTDHTFTAQPGDILFVSTQGNDSTARKNDIANPWRHVQTASEGGALAAVHSNLCSIGASNIIISRSWSTNSWKSNICTILVWNNSIVHGNSYT